jgi:hypothetical protein
MMQVLPHPASSQIKPLILAAMQGFGGWMPGKADLHQRASRLMTAFRSRSSGAMILRLKERPASKAGGKFLAGWGGWTG